MLVNILGARGDTSSSPHTPIAHHIAVYIDCPPLLLSTLNAVSNSAEDSRDLTRIKLV
jgi:hypothetical protein